MLFSGCLFVRPYVIILKVCKRDILQIDCGVYFRKFITYNKDEFTRFRVKKVKGRGHCETKYGQICTLEGIFTYIQKTWTYFNETCHNSRLPNWFVTTPRICNFILLLIVLVRAFSKMLPSVKFAKIRCTFSLFVVKNAKILQLKVWP